MMDHGSVHYSQALKLVARDGHFHDMAKFSIVFQEQLEQFVGEASQHRSPWLFIRYHRLILLVL
ncbi:hypothetical protein Pyn_34561 [Prunus yedoensis var. nudiflora]|uniref:Uncharacterized protein n=1 Tax=Prunus yedoensis var. nudiflora TaxID=2094558 RepID=A0A314YZ83_PRUYE|nr:hypothetical protein Pyn_34561 [Prunus yedoensis var. nudiflora]